MSYSVSQRTREIGIRVALGARNDEVIRMFVSHGARLAAVGHRLRSPCRGAADALHVVAAVRCQPGDPLTYLSCAPASCIAAVAASYVPALRATSVDPVQALRAE